MLLLEPALYKGAADRGGGRIYDVRSKRSPGAGKYRHYNRRDMPDRGERIVALEKAVIEAGGAGGGKGKTIEVQYNPLSLKIRAESRGTVMSGLLAAQEEGDIW